MKRGCNIDMELKNKQTEVNLLFESNFTAVCCNKTFSGLTEQAQAASDHDG